MEKPSPEKVKALFNNYYPVDIKYCLEFSKFLKVRTFSKNEILKDFHGIENYVNLLISGSVAHFVPSDGKEVCINIYYENQIFSDYLSFLTRKPSIIKTECLEDAVIWSISLQDLQKLYAQSAPSLAIGKAISDIMFIRKQSEQINLLTLTPTERYLKLIEEKPFIFQRTPLKIIASYLGMAPESLSRIRKKITH